MTKRMGIGLGVVLGVVGVDALLLLRGTERRIDSQDVPFLVVMGLAAAVIWSVSIWIASRRRTGNLPAGAGLFYGVLAVLGLAAFWTGLSLAFGAAGVLLSAEGSERTHLGERRAGVARAARWTAIVGLVAWIGIVIATAVTG